MTDQQPPVDYARAVVVFFDKASSQVYIDAQMKHFAELAHVGLVTDLRACTPLDDDFVRKVLETDFPRITPPTEQRALL